MENGIPRDAEKRRKRLYGWLQLALVIVFIGGAFLLSLYLASLQTVPNTRARRNALELLVETTVVAPRSQRLRFAATGTVQVRAMTDMVPQVSGRVVAIDDSAFPGGVFGPGTVLFEIEKTDYELAVERLKAEVARAQTRLEIQQANTETAIEEWRELNPDTPAPSLVAQKPQLEEARASLAAAEAQLKTARLDLARTDYRLPFAGRVTEFHMEIGQYAVAGQSYGSAYRLKSLEIDVPLEQQQFDWLQATDEPVISVSSDFSTKAVYRAYIKRVAGKLDPQTRFARVVLGLDEQKPGLVPDVFVHVRFIGPEKENVWVLPLDALQENGRIWAVTPEKTLRSLHPEIIQVTDEAVVAKSDGTSIRVVRGNLPEATESTPVRIAGETGAWAGTDGR